MGVSIDHNVAGVPDLYRGKWPLYRETYKHLLSPVFGSPDTTNNVTLDGLFWHFLPYILPENSGFIGGFSVIGQGNSGGGSPITLGWGVFEVEVSGSNLEISNIVASGTASTTDATNGIIDLTTAADIPVTNNIFVIGVGASALFNLQRREFSGMLPGMMGGIDASTHEVNAKFTTFSVGATIPSVGAVLSNAKDIPAMYISWKPY